MTTKLLPPNILVLVAPVDPERPDAQRGLAPGVACEQCKAYVTDGHRAHVYVSEFAHPATMPDAHNTIPIVVHDACLPAFLDKHPGRWARVCTVSEFVQRLARFVSLEHGAPKPGTGPTAWNAMQA